MERDWSNKEDRKEILNEAKRLIDRELSKGVFLSNSSMYRLLESNLEFEKLCVDNPTPLQRVKYEDRIRKEKRVLVSETMRWIRRQIICLGYAVKDCLEVQRDGRGYNYRYKTSGFSVYSIPQSKRRISQLDIALSSISNDKRVHLLDDNDNEDGIILPYSIDRAYGFREHQLQTIQSKAIDEINCHNKDFICKLIKENSLDNRGAVIEFLNKLDITHDSDGLCYLGICHQMIMAEESDENDIEFYSHCFEKVFEEQTNIASLSICRIMYAQILSVLAENSQLLEDYDLYKQEQLLLNARWYLIRTGENLIPVSNESKETLMKIYRQLIDVFEHQGREFAAKDIVREAYDLISNYDVNISWDKAYIFCKMAEYHPENNGEYKYQECINQAKYVISKLPKDEISFYFEHFIN